ncbi:MAG: hypothetical protein AB4290_16880 [Spirulina sp.]
MAISGGTTREWVSYLAQLQWGLVPTPQSFKFILADNAAWTSSTPKIDYIKTEIDEENGYSRYDLLILESEIIYDSLSKRMELSSPKRWNVTANGLALQWNGFALLANASERANALLESVNAATDTLTLTAHGLTDGDEVIIRPEAGATLPTGLTEDIFYVVNSTANNFQLSATHGGLAIDFTDNGSGDFRLKYANGLVVQAYVNDQTQTIPDGSTQPFDWDFKLFNSGLLTGNDW